MEVIRNIYIFKYKFDFIPYYETISKHSDSLSLCVFFSFLVLLTFWQDCLNLHIS